MEEWAQRLSMIFDGFNENDVFNADETGLVYRATLPSFFGLIQAWKNVKVERRTKKDLQFYCVRI